jgi:sporulation protein YlmC with PRC-barrel domain
LNRAAGSFDIGWLLIKGGNMNVIKNLALAGSVACLSATTLCAQQPTTTANAPVEYGAKTAVSTLNQANKASNLIGMDVRNEQNEKLGDIKDLVVDLHTGKIAYAVLSVGGFLGIGDKYIAVPPSQFSVAQDGKALILNADKAKIQAAPGFAKNDWPDLNSWNTHSSYWMGHNTALGTAGAVTSGRETGSGALAPKNFGENTLSGRVTAFDRASNMLTIEDASGKHQFRLHDQAAANLSNTSNARWDNVKVGEEVTVRFHHHNGNDVVDNITEANASIPNK